MNILVTGGLGFIGSNFIRYLISQNNENTILNIDKMGVGSNIMNLNDIQNTENYVFIQGDLLDYSLVERIMDEVDVVVNFAAETHVDRSIADPRPFMQSNIIGTFNLLEIERKLNNNVKHIQISTDETYGSIIKGSFRECSKLKPSNPYSATKAASDLLCQAYHRTYGLDAVIIRCTNNFGPYQFPEKLIPKTIIRALKNLPIPIYGTGESIRDWIYVIDHCEAIYRTLLRGKSGETYNVSSGNELSTLIVVKKIINILNKPENLITHVEDRPGHDIRYSLDSTKIWSELGWNPKHDFNHTLKKTIEWYLENDWWWNPIVNEKILHPTPWKLRK